MGGNTVKFTCNQGKAFVATFLSDQAEVSLLDTRQVLLCRLRYKMSYRDVAEFFLLRGFEFTHETVHDWEARFAPIFAEQ